MSIGNNDNRAALPTGTPTGSKFLRDDMVWTVPPAGSGGDSVTVNGAAATDANLSDTTPAAVASSVNARWQKDAATPNNISANVPTGSTGSTLCVGNDSRLSDARTPTAHTHPESEVTSLVTDLAGKAASVHTHAPSDTTGTAVITSDSRLSDARTPTTHATSHQSGGSDEISVTSLHGQLQELQFGAVMPATFEIPSTGSTEIPSTAWLEIEEDIGPRIGISYALRVHPYQDQCLAEGSSLIVCDYYDITEPYALEIPASALMMIDEGGRDFDIS